MYYVVRALDGLSCDPAANWPSESILDFVSFWPSTCFSCVACVGFKNQTDSLDFRLPRADNENFKQIRFQAVQWLYRVIIEDSTNLNPQILNLKTPSFKPETLSPNPETQECISFKFAEAKKAELFTLCLF